MRNGNKPLVVDRSGVHDLVVKARDLECQTKEHSGQLLGRAVSHTIDDGQQLNGTRGDMVFIGKSRHPLVINAIVELTLDTTSAKVVTGGVKHNSWGVETVECLIDNMSQQVDNSNKKFESDMMPELIQSP
ncbi:hypothetical protein RDI58_013758 [Solanum bulbocastanum]|uniref:Uncharacterized protein n=1 Tax=Solanum bulbocastanum TaxID=147425 RepID=A0AAN8YI21_SOLBU